MHKSLFWFSVLLILSLAAISCGQVPTPPEVQQQQPPPSTPAPTTGSTPPSAANWPAEAQSVIDKAVADVVQQAQVSAADVVVVKVEAVEWPDGCLGCAKPGQMCTQAIVPGFRVVLRAGGVEYEYHTSRQDIVLCLVETQVGDWGASQPLVELVVADLAGRLGIARDEIKVVSVEEKMWPDAGIGCPQPGYRYTQVITPGYRIVLEAGGKRYDYHTGAQANFILCEQKQQ